MLCLADRPALKIELFSFYCGENDTPGLALLGAPRLGSFRHWLDRLPLGRCDLPDGFVHSLPVGFELGRKVEEALMLGGVVGLEIGLGHDGHSITMDAHSLAWRMRLVLASGDARDGCDSSR